ncbi:hypothetical protein C0J52_08091, partial [Blattella germanica]
KKLEDGTNSLAKSIGLSISWASTWQRRGITINSENTTMQLLLKQNATHGGEQKTCSGPVQLTRHNSQESWRNKQLHVITRNKDGSHEKMM